MKLPDMSCLSFDGHIRESNSNDCDGRCRFGRIFGRGFDSRQVHQKSLTRKNVPKFFRVRVRFNISVIIARRKTASETAQDAVFTV